MENEQLRFELVKLRIKIKHLALEPALIALEERRARARAHYKAISSTMAEGANTPAYVDPWQRVRLNQHRLHVVRPEARAAQLAYAFLRGKSYDDVEPTSKNFNANLLARIAELAVKYGPYTDKKLAQESVVVWIEKSGRWKRCAAGWFEPVKPSQEKAA